MCAKQAVVLLGAFAARCFAVPWGGATSTVGLNSDASPDLIVPTAAPFGSELIVRDDSFPISLCGWIAGKADQPAWCSSSSSCVWNTDNGFVGCCSIGGSSCALYTSCVDGNSPQQTDDYVDVYTCPGTKECYLNTYPRNYVQYGCGSSSWATTVLTSISDYPQPLLVAFTGTDTPTPLSQPTSDSVVLSSEPTSSTTTTTTTSTSSSTSTPSSSAAVTYSSNGGSATAASTGIASDAATAETHSSGTPVGSIVGGTIGGVAALGALGAVFFIVRSRSRSRGLRDADNDTDYGGPSMAELESPKRVELESPNPTPSPFAGVSETGEAHHLSPSSRRNVVSLTSEHEPLELE